jgi:spoIIIJ-associated protein
MEWVETTGRTVEEAKDAALDQLGVDESDAEFVVVSEPRPGLFGRMRGEARVRARVAPTSPRPKRGRSRRSAPERRGGERQPRGGRASTAVVEDEEGLAPADAAASANGASGPGGAGSSSGGGQGGTGRRRSRGSRGRGSRGGGTGGQGREGQDQQARSAASGRDLDAGGAKAEARRRGRAGETAADEEGTPVTEMSLEEQGQAAQTFVEGLLREMGLDAAVSLRIVDDTTAEVAVDGEGLGVLVGPRGATLGALQELTRTVVQKHTGGHSERILVDVAGYRARRAEALQRFTTQVAEEVVSSGTERALEPMSAADRKVVHDAANEIDGVVTRSEGEEPRRYIVLSPSGGAPAADGSGADES